MDCGSYWYRTKGRIIERSCKKDRIVLARINKENNEIMGTGETLVMPVLFIGVEINYFMCGCARQANEVIIWQKKLAVERKTSHS